MRRISIRETLQFKRGRQFEQDFARDMIMRGHMVMRCYELGEDKAPMLEGRYAGYRLPDLQIIASGKAFWVECKEKSDCTYSYSLDRYDEGIDAVCYRDYCFVQSQSGMAVWLAIAEWKRKRVLSQTLDKLGPPRIVSPEIATYGKGGMAYWPCDQFTIWGSYNQKTGQLELPFGSHKKTRADA